MNDLLEAANIEEHLPPVMEEEAGSDQAADASEHALKDYRILLIEDDALLRRGLKLRLDHAGFQTSIFECASEALKHLPEINPDVVLADLFLGKRNTLDGLGVLKYVQARDKDLPVVIMTACGNIPGAIDAIRKGAYDYLKKPFEKDRLIGVLNRAAVQRRLSVENRKLREHLTFASGIERILIGQSAAMRSLSDLILLIAPTPANAIVLGETGSGKEMVARCLHEFSSRAGHFVPINCAAIPEHLFESELFGHEAGAYTGAAKQRVGKIEHANGGTLFLDEIEAMPMHLQSKLLRVIQERQIDRLGSNKTISVDLRVVAATKVDLKQHSDEGKFRVDLFYRLNVANLKIPPLRERPEDIPLLFTQFVHEAALRLGKPVVTPTAEILQQLRTQDWPGNVRELRNTAEQFQFGIPITFADPDKQSMPAAVQEKIDAPETDGGLDKAGSPDVQAGRGNPGKQGSFNKQAELLALEDSVAAFEKAQIAEALRRHAGVATAACSELKINYTTLYRKMKLYDMDLAEFKGLSD